MASRGVAGRLQLLSMRQRSEHEKKFRRGNALLFLLHLVSAVATVALAKEAGRARLFGCIARPSGDAGDKFYESTTYECRDEGHVNVQVLIVLEAVWTTSAHLFYTLKPACFLRWVLDEKLANFWFEYSISATLIFLVVQTMVGLVQPWMYVQNALLLAGMMLLPLYTEMATAMQRAVSGVSQTLMYFALLYPLAHQVGWARERTEMPTIAVAMFAMLVVLYSSFPAAYILYVRRRWTNARLASVLLVLSATSKFILRALIVAAVTR